MSNETQSQIFEAYLPSGQHTWINLTHVVSANSTFSQSGSSVLEISMVNGERYKLINDESESYTMWADQFIFAFNTFYNQNT
jgi:hypothetical protein